MYNNIFEGVDNANVAYWLGFLAADGSVKEDNNQLILGLSKQDKEHLKKFKQFIGSNANITDRDMLCSTNGKYYPSSILYVSSKKLIDDLLQYNIVTDKSHKNINFLQYIPEPYKIYFILGYFDGDGYYICTEKSQGFGWCGCEENIHAITDYIKQYLQLTTTSHCKADKRSSITYYFTDQKISDIRVFCEFYLNQVNTIDLLERKVKKAKQLLEFIANKTSRCSNEREDKMTTCIICNKLFHALSKNTGKYCSQECVHIAQRRSERPDRSQLKQLIRTTSFLQIGKQFNVTDNTIRKWCKSLNLPHRSQDIKKYSEQEWELI